MTEDIYAIFALFPLWYLFDMSVVNVVFRSIVGEKTVHTR